MGDQAIDYKALAEQANQTAAQQSSDGAIDYHALADHARRTAPGSTLLKPEPLTQEEQALIRPGGVTVTDQDTTLPSWAVSPSAPVSVPMYNYPIDPATGQRSTQPQLMTQPAEFQPLTPTESAITAPLRFEAGAMEQTGQGLVGLRHPQSARQMAGAASDVIRGTFGTATPLILPELLANPIPTLTGLLTFGAAQTAAEKGATALGVAPEYSRLLGDILGMFGGDRVHRFLTRMAQEPDRMVVDEIYRKLEEYTNVLKNPDLDPAQRNAARAAVESLVSGMREQEPSGPPNLFPSIIPGIGRMNQAARTTYRGISNLPGSLIPERFKVTPDLTPQAAESNAYLENAGVKIPLSMATGSDAAQLFETGLGKSPGGGAYGRQIQAGKEQLVEYGKGTELPRIYPQDVTKEQAGAAVGGELARHLEDTRNNLLEEVHPTPTTPEAAGQSVIDKGKQIIKQYNQQANDAYGSAWERAGDPRLTKEVPIARDETGGLVMGKVNMPVDIRWLKDVARQELPNLQLLPAATQAQKAAVSIYKAVLAANDYVPAQWAENALSGLKEEARGAPSPEERSYSQGVAAGVIPKLQAGIDAAVAEAGPEALDALRAGRAATAQKYGVSDVFRNFGRDINDLEPVQVFNRMTWGRDSGINQLRAISQIAPESMPEVGRAFIEGGGHWSELGPETKNILFHGDQNLIDGLDQYHADLAQFGPLTKLEPVALFDRLTQPEARTINQLRAVAKQAPEQMRQLGRAFVQGLIDRATREGDIAKVQGTLDKWLDLDPQSKSIMYEDPKLIRDLNALFFSMKRMAANPNPSGSGFMMGLNQLKGRLMTGAGITLGGVVGGSPANMMTGLGILGSAGVEVGSNAWLARKVFDPRFRQMLIRGMDMQNRGNLAGARLMAAQILKDFPPEEGPPEGPPTPGGAPPPSTPPSGGGAAETPPGKAPAAGEQPAPEMGKGPDQALAYAKQQVEAGKDVKPQDLQRRFHLGYGAAQKVVENASVPEQGQVPAEPQGPVKSIADAQRILAERREQAEAATEASMQQEATTRVRRITQYLKDQGYSGKAIEKFGPDAWKMAGHAAEGLPPTPQEIEQIRANFELPETPPGKAPSAGEQPAGTALNPRQHFDVQSNAADKLGDALDTPPGWRDKLNQAADDAGARIAKFWKNQGTTLHAGLPVDVLADYSILGARKIVDGFEKFGDWSKEMLEASGQQIQPHLRAIWKEAQHIAGRLGWGEGGQAEMPLGNRLTVPAGPVDENAPKIAQKTVLPLVQKHLDNLDVWHQRNPNMFASDRDYIKGMNELFQFKNGRVPIPPENLIAYANEGPALGNSIDEVSPQQRALAEEGLKASLQVRQKYADGSMTPQHSAMYFGWGALSPRQSPYPQEAGFLHALDNGLERWINLSAQGKFTEANLPAYLKWSADTLKGTPGAQATSNLNAFGKNFLINAGLPVEHGPYKGMRTIDALHEIIADPNLSAAEARRRYQQINNGLGLDNKVFSFVLLVTGHHDTLVADRVRINDFWNAPELEKQGLAYTTSEEGTRQPTRNLYDNGMDAPWSGITGLGMYEAAENALRDRVRQAYADRGIQDGTIGRWHWETWVAKSGQEVSHGSLGAIPKMAEGMTGKEAAAGESVRQGKYNDLSYGVRYERTPEGFRYNWPLSDGSTVALMPEQHARLLQTLREMRDKKTVSGYTEKQRAVQYGTKTSEATDAPWRELPGVNKAALDGLIRRFAQ